MGDTTRPTVFVDVPHPVVNGITIYSVNLVRGLRGRGYDARILLTETDTVLVHYSERTLDLPAGVPVDRLPVDRQEGWGAHWGALVRFLTERAPCVFVPNSDFRHSCVSPRLPDDVVVLGIPHATDPVHYEHARRLGAYWNRIVCVSTEVADRIREECPDHSDRVLAVSNGVPTPTARPSRPRDGPLELVYHGAFKQYQKRVLDLPRIARALADRGLEARLTLIGSGPDEDRLRAEAAELIDEGRLRIEPPLPYDEMLARLADFHVYLLTSEFEGMPQALLEAMAQGCVPVATRSVSGSVQVVRDGGERSARRHRRRGRLRGPDRGARPGPGPPGPPGDPGLRDPRPG